MRQVVALDLATRTGWAYGLAHLNRPVFGTCKIIAPPDEPGAFYVHFSRWLAEFLTEVNARVVIYESPVLPRLTRIETLRRLYWMGGQTEMICASREADCYEAAPSTVKKFWTGSGAAKKADMMASARARGYCVTDDNQADALALWHYYCSSVCNAGRKRGRT
jgi:crossover junction endodeoxyribonuclease RuvC